jgi:hypothetical protein
MLISQIELDEVFINQIADDQLETLGASLSLLTDWTCASVTMCGCYS